MGTDSAPHLTHAKESSCGCAGIFNVANAIAVVTQVFESEKALDKLEKFLSLNGPAFYQLPVNKQRMTLIRSNNKMAIPDDIEISEGKVTTFDPMMNVYWQVA